MNMQLKSRRPTDIVARASKTNEMTSTRNFQMQQRSDRAEIKKLTPQSNSDMKNSTKCHSREKLWKLHAHSHLRCANMPPPCKNCMTCAKQRGCAPVRLNCGNIHECTHKQHAEKAKSRAHRDAWHVIPSPC